MPLKSNKLISQRLINYHEDGITWKMHKDKILDFWILFKAKDYGFTPSSLKDFRFVDKLPNSAREAYTEWFKGYNFQNEDDKDWIKWLDFKFNFFYKTHS